jgi:outer membrane autotransporter protein
VVGVALSHPSRADTVNPVQTTTYNLAPSNNPITFGSGTKINAFNDAVYGSSAANWTITNQGYLEASAAPAPDADYGVVGAGLAYSASRQLTYFGRYEAALGQHQRDNAFTAGFKFVW